MTSADMCLDCSSPETALDTSAHLLDVPDSVLRDLSTRELDWAQAQETEGDVLVRHLGFSLHSVPQPDSVRWFHATRVPKDTTFAEGILPFSSAYEVMWRLLEQLAQDIVGSSGWESFKDGLRHSHTNAAQRLRLKRKDEVWQGPFAHLVRDRAIKGYEPPFHRSYTVCPEVVEEVSREFEEQFGISILERYQKMTKPCIVSFRRGGAPKRVVGDALGYLYFSLRGEDVPAWCDTVFSGKGETVPKAQIDAIEWL
jgi:hypothetical protein